MSPTSEAIRHANLKHLEQAGFEVAPSLPLAPEVGSLATQNGIGGAMRPLEEIVQRYLAMVAVFAWASGPTEMAEMLNEFIERNKLRDWMVEKELEVVDTSKDEAVEKYQSIIGWKLENMWPLTWIIGLTPPPSPIVGQIDEELISFIMNEFLPAFEVTTEKVLEKSQIQPLEDIVAMHDLYFCAHNAARSAKLGNKTVPEQFNAIADGGVIHERRHSLSWVLSPGTAWESVDLHT